MGYFGYFWHLADSATGFLAYFGLVTMPLFLTACFVVGWTATRPGANPRKIAASCVAPAIVPICLLIVGVAFVHPDDTIWAIGYKSSIQNIDQYSEDVPKVLINSLSFVLLPLGLGLAWWSGQSWPAAVAATVWWACVSFCAGVVASMSVSSTWL